MYPHPRPRIKEVILIGLTFFLTRSLTLAFQLAVNPAQHPVVHRVQIVRSIIEEKLDELVLDQVVSGRCMSSWRLMEAMSKLLTETIQDRDSR